jgi:hypothetical protein
VIQNIRLSSLDCYRIILTASVFVSALLALSVLAISDFGTHALAQTITPKMHLDEGVKALKANDNQGSLMHLGVADKILSGGSG